MIHVRIVNTDFYMSPPVPSLDVLYSEFRGVSVNHVPIIRIFGTTTKGDKTCLHVHGVFPYIYIPYDGKDSPESVTYQVAASLDKAINLSLGQASSNVQHVYKVSLVSGIPMYGYHSKKHQFLKIYFYNPLIVKKACNLLQQGNILGRVFQPHEAHLPYLLQFMIDYNLQGMSFIDLSQIKYRFDSNNSDLPSDMLLPSSLKKLSICKIEMDARAEHILNHLQVTNGKLAINPGIKALWDDEKQRRRNKGDESQIGCCLTQTRSHVPPTATHMAFMQVLQDKLTCPVENSQTNFSVYPMETPSSGSLLDASTIDSHPPVEETNDHDITLNDSVFDDDAKYLLDLLEDLRDNNRIEEDSILSQVAKDNDDNEVDLSLPLEASCESFDLFSNSIRIPQLDGSCDVDDDVRRSKPLTLQSYEVTKKKPVKRVRLFNYRKRKTKTKIVNQIDDLKQISAAETNTKSGTKRKRKRRIYLAGSYNLRSKDNFESKNPDISPHDLKTEKVPVEDFNLKKELSVKNENFQETLLENDQNVCVNLVHSEFSPKKPQDLPSNDNVDSEVFPKTLQDLSTNVVRKICTSSSGVNLKFSPKKLQDLSLIEKIPPGNSNFFEDLLSNDDKIISTGVSPDNLQDCVESKSSPKKLRNILANDTKKICAENGLLKSEFSPKKAHDLSSNNSKKICTTNDTVNSKFFPNNVKNRRVKLRSSDIYSVRQSYKKIMIKQNTDDLKQISAAETNTKSGIKLKRIQRIYLAGSYNLRSKGNSESENPDISPHDSKTEKVPMQDFNLKKELNVKNENFQETLLENDQNVCVNPVHSEFSPQKPQDLSSNDNVDSEVFPKNLQDLSTNVVRKIFTSSSGVNLKFSPKKLIEKIPPENSNFDLLSNDDKIISTGVSPDKLRDCVESKSSPKKLRNILANDTKSICAENGLLHSEFSPKNIRGLSSNNSRKICTKNDSVNSKFFPNNLTHLRTNVNKVIENHIEGSQFSPKKHRDHVESMSSPKKLQDHVERKSSPKKLRSMLENDAQNICTENDRVDSSLGDLSSADLKKICTRRVNSKFFPKDDQDSLLNVEICTENSEMFSPRKLQDLPLNDSVDSVPNKPENLSSHDIKKNCIENCSVKSELFSKIESPNQVKKFCNVDDNVDSKFFSKGQASNDAEKICTKNLVDLEYSSKRLRNHVDLKFSPRKLRKATENDHVEFSPMRLRSHVLSKVSHNNLRDLLPNDDKICTGDHVDNMEISPQKDFSLNVVPKVCNGNDVDIEFSPKSLQGFSSKPTENDSQVGCEANSLQITENQFGNKKSRLSKRDSKQSLNDSNHVLDKPVNEFQDNSNEFLNSQNFIIKVNDSIVSVNVCENTMISGDEFNTETAVSPKVRDRIIRKVSEKQSPKKNSKLALKNDRKKGSRRSDLDFLMENSPIPQEFDVEVEGDSNCRYSLRKGLKFNNKFESIPKDDCCVSGNTSTNKRKNPKKKVEKIHPESNLDDKVTLDKILDMPEIDIQHTDLNKIYCSLTKEEKGVQVQSSSGTKVSELKKKIETSPRKNFVFKKFPIQKINNAATPILSPKFRIVPANRPYRYVPKRAGKNKSTTMKKMCEIRKSYPNTSWMFCVRKGNVVLKDQSSNSGKIDIISDKILLEHEKFDISELPRGNVTSIISHKRDSSANQTNETPKISDDAEIINTLSLLYDEIMYDSNTLRHDDDVLKEFSYDALFLPEELEELEEFQESFETNNFEEFPLSFEPKQDMFVCTRNEATDLHNGAPSPRKIIPVIMFDEASQDSGRSTKKSRRFSTDSVESDVYISDYEVKVEENGIFDRAHDDVQSDDSKNVSQPIIEDVSSPIISQNNESLISPLSDEAKTSEESINDDSSYKRPVRPVSSRERYVSLSEDVQITGTFSVTSNFFRAINYKLPDIDDDYFDRIKRDRDYRNTDRIFCYEVSEQKDLDFRCSFANRFCNFDLLDENAHLLRNNERFRVFLDSNVRRSRSTDSVSSTGCAKRCDDKLKTNRGCVVDQYRYLDGANDSSSDDDQMEKVVKKRHVGAFLSQASKYSPLRVKIHSPRASKKRVLGQKNLKTC